MPVVVFAFYAEVDDAEHDEGNGKHRNGSAPGPALEFSIEEGHEEKERGEQAGNDNDGEHHLRSFPELEPLEHGQVIPFRSRKELGVSRVGDGAEACGMKVRDETQAYHQQQRQRHV